MGQGWEQDMVFVGRFWKILEMEKKRAAAPAPGLFSSVFKTCRFRGLRRSRSQNRCERDPPGDRFPGGSQKHPKTKTIGNGKKEGCGCRHRPFFFRFQYFQNLGIWESRDPGIWESRDLGIWESRDPGIWESMDFGVFRKIEIVKKGVCGCSHSNFFEPISILSKTKFLSIRESRDPEIWDPGIRDSKNPGIRSWGGPWGRCQDLTFSMFFEKFLNHRKWCLRLLP